MGRVSQTRVFRAHRGVADERRDSSTGIRDERQDESVSRRCEILHMNKEQLRKIVLGLVLFTFGVGCIPVASVLYPWSADAVNPAYLGVLVAGAAIVLITVGIGMVAYGGFSSVHRILSELTCCPAKKRTGSSRGRRNR